jgi:hypothetical protein
VRPSATGYWQPLLEELERLGSFSSFYTGASALQRLQIIRELGFGSSEMAAPFELVAGAYWGCPHKIPNQTTSWRKIDHD